jgi:hypothetical protein
MNVQQRKAGWMAFLGLLFIALGAKYLPDMLAMAAQQQDMSSKPFILFFNVEDPCECMVELTQQAETQIANWPVEQRGGIAVLHIAIDERRDLEAKYKVFRAPCLVLVSAEGEVLWRQDYPLVEGGPFKLEELEAAIAEMGPQ